LPQNVDYLYVTTADDLVQLEIMLNRFNRLMSELARGVITRNTFFAWEVDLLLDIQSCALESRRRTETMRQYQRAVERQMETGPGPPMRLSQFLVIRAQRAPIAGDETAA
jgi:hypothetical protein